MYDKHKTFDKAEKYLKGRQNVEPDKRNYFSKGWYNKHYGSRREAGKAYARALKVWKSRKS